MSPEALVAGAREGRPRDVARLISLVEDGSAEERAAVQHLLAGEWPTSVVGITGAPGVGKSTTTSALVTALRARGDRVGVLAVDPSSPFSGGALLGDRVRMSPHASDDGVFIRSMAARGHLGGLAATTPAALRVLAAAGFATVLVETVGVGQSEVEVAAAADTVLVLLAPGMGDGIQAAKAGILEIADVLVVNKADHEGAPATARQLRAMTALAERSSSWHPPIVLTVATEETGIAALLEAIDTHAGWLVTSGEGGRRRLRSAQDEIRALALADLAAALGRSDLLVALAEHVVSGRLDAVSAAATLRDAIP